MIFTILSASVFVIFALIFLVFYIKPKKKYDEYMEYVDKKEYGLKDFIPIGLEMNEVNISMPLFLKSKLAAHNNRVNQRILELRGPKPDDIAFYQFIHKGYRLAVGMVVSLGASFMGFLMSVQGGSDGVLFTGMAILAFFVFPFATDSSLNGDLSKRRLAIQTEFPEFVNKLTLLVNAGMTTSKAWEKIVNDNKKKHILYNEMQYVFAEIQAGKPEPFAYEAFARRCHVKEVTKFVSIIVMNLKRGGAEIVPVLKAQGDECWEMRKNAAKEMGEQANTKILIPMMLMFVGIVLIVATPAVLSMTGGM